MIAVSRHCWALERLGGFANTDRDFFDLEDFLPDDAAIHNSYQLHPWTITIQYTHQYMYYTGRNLSDFGRTYPTFVLLPRGFPVTIHRTL